MVWPFKARLLTAQNYRRRPAYEYGGQRLRALSLLMGI